MKGYDKGEEEGHARNAPFDSSQTLTGGGSWPFPQGAEYELWSAAGDFADDFDLESAAAELVDRVNEIIHPFGVSTTVSGDCYMNLDADFDGARQALAEAYELGSLDCYDILERHDISSGKPVPSLAATASASVKAANALSRESGRDESMHDVQNR